LRRHLAAKPICDGSQKSLLIFGKFFGQLFAPHFIRTALKLTLVERAALVNLGSKPTFAAAAHEINLKLEGEWQFCGQSCRWPSC
jgi:hypothetical protein